MIETSLSQSDPIALPQRPFGRVARSVIGYSLLTALMIVVPMPVFVPAVLLHCALRNGRGAAWATLGLSMALVSLYTAVVPAFGVVDVVFTFFVIALPALIVLPLVERGQNLGRVLVLMLIATAIGLVVTEVAAREVFSFSVFAEQAKQTREMNAKIVDFYRVNGMGATELARGKQWLEYGVSLLPAGILMSVAVFFILSLLMLGRLKVWRDVAAQRGGEELPGAYLFRNFRLPDWMLFAFIIGGITPLLHGVWQIAAANVLAITVFLYIVQGLAIFRFMLASAGVGLAGTMAAVMLLGCLTITLVPPLLLGVAGLFDPFFDFRHFKKRKDDSNESHSD